MDDAIPLIGKKHDFSVPLGKVSKDSHVKDIFSNLEKCDPSAKQWFLFAGKKQLLDNLEYTIRNSIPPDCTEINCLSLRDSVL
jgi:hypothetical protein